MYYFIINPKSRTGMGAEVWQQVQAKIKQKKLPSPFFYRIPGTRYKTGQKHLQPGLSRRLSRGHRRRRHDPGKYYGNPSGSPRYFLPTSLPDPETTLPEVWRFPKFERSLKSRSSPARFRSPMDVGTLQAENRTGAFGSAAEWDSTQRSVTQRSSSRLKAASTGSIWESLPMPSSPSDFYFPSVPSPSPSPWTGKHRLMKKNICRRYESALRGRRLSLLPGGPF